MQPTKEEILKTKPLLPKGTAQRIKNKYCTQGSGIYPHMVDRFLNGQVVKWDERHYKIWAMAKEELEAFKKQLSK